MEILNNIQDFRTDIYFKMPIELNDDYVNICEKISTYFSNKFCGNKELKNDIMTLMEYLLEVMQSGDYIKMADALVRTVKPIIEDAEVLMN